MSDRTEDLKELLEGFKRIKAQTLEVRVAYETIRGLKKIIETIPESDTKTNLINQTAQLEVEAMLNEAAIHSKEERLIDLQKFLAVSKYNSRFCRNESDESDFKEKMLEINPEYYRYESLKGSK